MRGDVAEAFGLAGLGHSTGTYTPPADADVEDPEQWRKRAACRPDLRPPEMTPAEWVDIFFTDRGQSTSPARAICLDCPVQAECLGCALDQPEKFGVWGGRSERQRRRMRSTRPRSTDARRQVVALVREGYTDQRIASRLALSLNVVRDYRTAAGIYRRRPHREAS